MAFQMTDRLRSMVGNNLFKEPIQRHHSRDELGRYDGLVLTLVILAELWGESGCAAVQCNLDCRYPIARTIQPFGPGRKD